MTDAKHRVLEVDNASTASVSPFPKPGPSTPTALPRRFAVPRGKHAGGRDGIKYLMGGNFKDPLNLKSVKPVQPQLPAEAAPEHDGQPNGVRGRKHNKKKRRGSNANLIVSPVVARHHTWRHPKRPRESIDHGHGHQYHAAEGPSVSSEQKPARAADRHKQKNKAARFRYGNFNQYYRRGPFQEDPRLSLLCDDWFTGKRVLDLGCSNGTLTLSIARAFSPSRIVGIDIDPVLVRAARQTHRFYIDKEKKLIGKFPASFALNFGPVSTIPTSISTEFPYNVSFEARNYVFNHDAMLDKVDEEFDVILAFSLTKWVHLNFGDDGLKRLFKRVYRNLRPGGRFILETQRYDSYRKHRRVHVEMEANYARMRFFPESFHDYLLSEEVGFKHVEDISSPLSISLGCWKLEAYYKSELLVPPAVDSVNSTDPAPRVQWNDPTRSPLDTEDAVNYELSLTPSR